MAPVKGRARLFADLEERPAKDYDPEDEAPAGQSDDEQSEEDDLAGTEHYVSTGKSKLRKNEVSLGPEYRGTRVSRAALDDSDDQAPGSEEEEEEEDSQSDDEEYDDPEDADPDADSVGSDAEIDSDDAFGSSDEEKFKKFTFRGSSKPVVPDGKRSKRPVAADFLSESEDEGDQQLAVEEPDDEGADLDEDDDESDALDQENGVDLTGSEESKESDDEDESEGDDEEEEDEDEGAEDAGRAELRKIMNEGQKAVVATVSQAAKADTEKGIAVRRQRRAFDSLLNIRIRLQKALVAVNSLGVVVDEDGSPAKEPYEAAEEAAVKLWNTIDSFRTSLLPESAKAGRKRKREVDATTPSEEMWDEMEDTEGRAASHRKKVLEKWSNRVKSTTAVVATRKVGTAPSQSLVSVLEDQLINPDRLIKRTRTPRSCAPVQATRKVEEDADIYDDADFYQLLLKELVDQRSTDTSTPGGAVPTVRWAAVKEVKTRKLVDRKASKGRKLRFNVHEKIQNLMAPEDRTTWEQDAMDRLFGTLFGQKMQLEENEESDKEMGGAPVEDGGIKLFRS